MHYIRTLNGNIKKIKVLFYINNTRYSFNMRFAVYRDGWFGKLQSVDVHDLMKRE
jgi:hypothetical protein